MFECAMPREKRSPNYEDRGCAGKGGPKGKGHHKVDYKGDQLTDCCEEYRHYLLGQ
jgi:hypothetical protein